MYTFFTQCYAIAHLIDSSVNITFLCTGKPEIARDSLYFDIHFIAVAWNQTRNISEVRCT